MAETLPSPKDKEEEEEEEHEEGEISEEDVGSEDLASRVEPVEVENSGTDISTAKEVPLLQQRASLDELRQGKRNDVQAEEERDIEIPGDDDEDTCDGNGGWLEDKVWGRESVSFPPNGAYGSNLYNFAWAQAVQGRPSFPLGDAQEACAKGDRVAGSGWTIESLSRETSREFASRRKSGRFSKGEREELFTSAGRARFVGGLGREDVGRGKLRGLDSETARALGKKLVLKRRPENGGRIYSEYVDNDDVDHPDHVKKRPRSDSPPDLCQNGESSLDSTVRAKGEGNGAEDLEEGELEEGEIELPIPAPRTDVPLDMHKPSRDTEDYIPEHLLWITETDKYPVKSNSKLHPRIQIEQYSSRRHRRSRSLEYENGKRLSLAAELVKNVTVKDAQKSFNTVCGRLHKALRVLDEVHAYRQSAGQEERLEGSARDLTLLARQAFAGIRAVYAVRNTASGREQERDKNSFPRLLELANGYCQKLFTSKQTRELEGMMQTIASAGRSGRSESVEKVPYLQVRHFQVAPKKPQDVKQTDISSISPPGSSLTRSSSDTESALDYNISGRLLGFTDVKQVDEAAAIAAAALAYAQSSAAARANASHVGILSSRISGAPSGGTAAGAWSWIPDTSSQMQIRDQSMVPFYGDANYNTSAAKYHQLWNKSGEQTIFENHVESRGNKAAGSVFTPHPNSSVEFPTTNTKQVNAYGIEEEWEDLSPPRAGAPFTSSSTASLQSVSFVDVSGADKLRSSNLETRAVTIFKNNLVGPSLFSGRLPSPTPSEEDEDSSSGQLLSSVGPEKSRFQIVEKLPTAQNLTNSSHNSVQSQIMNSNAQTNTKPDTTTDLQLHQFAPVTSADIGASRNVTSLFIKGGLKSRDPRRRLQNPVPDDIFPMDLNSRVDHVVSGKGPEKVQVPDMESSRKHSADLDIDSDELPREKRQKVHPELDDESDQLTRDSSYLPSGTGGWLDDSIAPSSEDGPLAMEIDDIATSKLPHEETRAGCSYLDGSISLEEVKSTAATGISTNLVSTRQKIESGVQVGDKGPRKMKARDPRRALLESALERSEICNANQTEDNVSLVVTTRGHTESKSSELSSSVRNAGELQAQSLLPNIAPNFMEKLTSLAGMVVSSPFSSGGSQSIRPTSNGAMSSSTDCKLHDVNKVAGIRDSESADSVEHVASGSGVVGEQVTPNFQENANGSFGSLGALLRKPKGSPRQWGASQVHPGMEKYLEELNEEERRAVQLERERRMEEQDRMFSAGKLCLVLDLDHTLLNSAKFSEIEPEWDTRLRAAEVAERNRSSKDSLERRELYRFSHMSMWTKLRPGIWKFLARASQLYELHVYTMGNKVYATEMAKLLDPTGTLFAGRVISKGDDGDGDDCLPKSKDLDGVLGMESAVVIIDDSARVWPHHHQNLIVVERYMYFPCSRRQFGLAGPSLLEVGHDERETDGMLASALAVIDKIHQRFFENQRLREVDVREILAAEQRRVLENCKIVFSRVFPVGEVNPDLHPLWRTAQQFGAVCTTKLDEQVTHVVAISLGTDKVNWALATGRHVVRPAWLEASTILYRRANEREFPVPP